ncbi:MAG: hypothetical protein ACREL5_04340 [Gemmatimonadales bacterium]
MLSTRAVVKWSAVLPIVLTSTPRGIGAQTIDLPRQAISIGIGLATGTELWSVSQQPIRSTFEPDADMFGITRRLHGGIEITGSWVRYLGDHLGVFAAVDVTAFRLQTGCELLHDDGDAVLAAACRNLSTSRSSAATTALTGGAVARMATHRSISPYVRVGFGFAMPAADPIETVAAVANQQITIYRSRGGARLQPLLAMGLGATTISSSGIQTWFELRDSWWPQPGVASPTPVQDLQPITNVTLRSAPAVIIGISLVLKVRRGRRY